MSTSGTYTYNPAASNLVLQAFSRIGIRRPEITSQHMEDASQESNLVQVKFGNLQPNLWTDELYQVALTQGTITYTLPSRLIAIQAAYITTTSGGVAQDRIVWPISTFEYASLPNKTQQAPPTSYWLNMQITPQISMWPVPDQDDVYTLNLRFVRQMQDATIPNGTLVDVPYRWLDVFVAELSYRLARIYKPEVEAMRKADAAEAWVNAATEDQEQVPIYIQPDFSGYYGRG